MKYATKIGIDFGGVIVKPMGKESFFDFGEGKGAQQDRAIESITELNKLANNEVWIISKANRSTKAATRQWLDAVDFYQATGFFASNLLFCAKRSEKRNLCEALEITHFVDDSTEVLTSLLGVVPHLYLFGNDCAPAGMHAARNWQQLMQLLDM